MTSLRPNISVIPINVNGLNSFIKRKNILILVYKARLMYILYKRAHLKQNDSERLKIKNRARYSKK